MWRSKSSNSGNASQPDRVVPERPTHSRSACALAFLGLRDTSGKGAFNKPGSRASRSTAGAHSRARAKPSPSWNSGWWRSDSAIPIGERANWRVAQVSGDKYNRGAPFLALFARSGCFCESGTTTASRIKPTPSDASRLASHVSKTTRRGAPPFLLSTQLEPIEPRWPITTAGDLGHRPMFGAPSGE